MTGLNFHSHFGKAGSSPPNWRDDPEEDPDDDAPRPASDDVKRMLGVDPHELFQGEDDEMNGQPQSPEVNAAHAHIGAVVSGLLKLVDMPAGQLDKKAVFDAASEMIAQGAFPTPAAKQGLIVELANLPDDEPDLRKAIGKLLLQTAATQRQMVQVHGEPQ